MEKIFYYLIIFFMLCFFSSCYSYSEIKKEMQVENVRREKDILDKIVRFFRSTWPNHEFLYPEERWINGPLNAQRWPVVIPIPVEAYFFYPFSEEFLKEERKDIDDLKRIIAENILLLKKFPVGFKRRSTLTYDGETVVECTTYYVLVEKAKYSSFFERKIEELTDELLNDNFQLQRRAMNEIRTRGIKPGEIAIFVEIFKKSKDIAIKEIILSLLSDLGIKVQGFLIEALKDKSPRIRTIASTILGTVGNKDAIPFLRELLQDKYETVKKSAEKAIAEINTKVNPHTNK